MNLAGVGNYVYQEDTKGRLAALENPFNRTFSMGYDPDGKNILTTFPNSVQESRTYTPRDWLSMIQITEANHNIADTFQYLYNNASSVYDPTGHLQQEVDAGNRVHAFVYNHLYELTQEAHPDFGTISYMYDANGNRTQKTSSAGTDYYGVDAANKLLWVNQGSNAAPTSGQANPYTLFSYDPNGNMSHRERKYGAPYSGVTRIYDFYWDGDDRLRNAKQSGVTAFSANYDGEGVRVYKSDTWTSAHNFTWGPDGVLFDSNSSSTYTPGLAQNQGGADRYLHSDWIGSTRYLSDSTGNNFPGMLRYDAFGGRSASGGSDGYYPSPSQFASDFGYQTEYASTTEPGVGLEYLGQRYYDPSFGRFVTTDPSGFEGGLNLYGYCGNDPVNGADPSGSLPVPVITGLIGAGIGGTYEGYQAYQSSGGDWHATLAGVGRGALIGGIAGATGGWIEMLGEAAIGGTVAGAVANGAVSSAIGDLAGQTTAVGLGVSCGYSGEETLAAGLTGGAFALGGQALQEILANACFVAGTPVCMADGSTKAIEEVSPGDTVLARDPQSGQDKPKRVKQVFEREARGTVALTFDNGERIETTEGHLFYVQGQGFVAAGRLSIGALIVTRTGPAVRLTKVEEETGAKKVYNFEVEDFHTYFVGVADGGVWGHNLCYRAKFLAAHPDLDPDDVFVHHAVEQQVLKKFPGMFTKEEIHDLANLRGIRADDNVDIHLRIIRGLWDAFYDVYPNATKGQITGYAEKLDQVFAPWFIK